MASVGERLDVFLCEIAGLIENEHLNNQVRIIVMFTFLEVCLSFVCVCVSII